MPEALSAARKGGGAYATQSQCLDKFPVCIQRSDVPAWTPKPSGYCLAKGVAKAVAEKGILGAFTGGLTATAGGVAAAVFFGVLMAIIFKPKDKR